MAVVNFRIPEEMKRKLAGIAKATGASQTEMVKAAVAEKLAIHEVARAKSSANIPSWVPEGKYVALVRGAVAAVGESVAEVVSGALTKFPDDAIHVARKGRPIKAVKYAFLAQTEVRCWKYVTVDQQSAEALYICIWIYMPRNRMAKTIAISDEVYELLKKSRLPGESFSVTIRRNLKKNKLADIIGSGTISLDDWREARARLLSAETRTSEKLTGRS
jgi:predicted CopG family antitoxin/predicted transcriptional regulator